MAVYTLHVPAEDMPGDPAALGDAVLLKDGFAWGAFIFQVFWCLYHRLWLVALALAVVTLGVSAGLQWFGLPSFAVTVISLLIAAFFALEANGLRRRKLERHGFRPAGVVVADSYSDAEARAFSAWLDTREPGIVPPGRTTPTSVYDQPRHKVAAGAAGTHPVLGLFPDQEGPR
ncbi:MULTISPECIES: DUF2628 domain-containing protein [unclassified Chelatococcus]|uniref:DUF2628 domain-containing protein n=1 Tax=unclassified Chelatococcus TaxID=2638111 RepID=UPI001BD02632|nr:MULTISPECIES: DUF2628 domain-containing protein [unclassified Chelatococcus]CAH1657075.1 conserved membrane hypothetical protein [Hyphomicrobiales bacterium]MBS7740630.1 DUF2628 domain-containing protein [Chelatococcus sp. HY11]MBX3544586.1 DUF2628 domain-containing protein [Chelatococcus sp.]MCO5079883.1 DUF2628 domain-containing protein [Chelatococcus sp.]CAH1684536.1 conserved membrane hypothetical protein [Hyphomicrobiales bacterium]